MLMISFARGLAILAPVAAAVLVAGCANPGPPKPPSLQLPAVVTDLNAERHGDRVDLHFTLPEKTTDGLALRASQVSARICRAVETGPCRTLGSFAAMSFHMTGATHLPVELHDTLVGDLAEGRPRLLTYRVEVTNPQGKSAGFSDATYAPAGAPPDRVEGLAAEGTRLGTLLRWSPVAGDGEVLLVREAVNAGSGAPSQNEVSSPQRNRIDFDPVKKTKVPPAVVTLKAEAVAVQSDPGGRRLPAMLDTTVVPGTPYRYTAERRRTLQLGGHQLELWSGASPAIQFTLHDTFPPPAPVNLSVAGFAEAHREGEKDRYAVDLIWDPVQDEQLAGFRVYRTEIDAGDRISNTNTGGRGLLLSMEIVKTPAFHDTTANGSRRYRYSVTSVDLKGNESDAATAVLEPNLF